MFILDQVPLSFLRFRGPVPGLSSRGGNILRIPPLWGFRRHVGLRVPRGLGRGGRNPLGTGVPRVLAPLPVLRERRPSVPLRGDVPPPPGDPRSWAPVPDHPYHRTVTLSASGFRGPKGDRVVVGDRVTGVAPRAVNEIVLGRRSITPRMSIRFGAFFGQADQFWHGLQVDYDFRVIALERDRLVARINPV